ncbi:MAG: hypothetical protein M3Y27_24700 [Acidobacteriota bacterium]|nr:hypothetical protein [Acidobacteriota bacterium]
MSIPRIVSRHWCRTARLFSSLALLSVAYGQTIGALDLHKVTAKSVNYKGRTAVRIEGAGSPDAPDGSQFAVVRGTDFQDGTIEVDLSGDTKPGADPSYRGFVGIAFRTASDLSKYECLYLRPKNGRSNDQLQRNHSVQYISAPDFPWQLLREKFPAKYESYVDLVPGEWTKVKIEVKGESAKLYVNAAGQPILVVNDLKHAVSRGAIALWIGPGTLAHFASLRVSP